MKIVASKKTGQLHKDLGLPCQDAVVYFKQDGIGAIVLCDGAGSVENSEEVSNALAQYLPEYLTSHFCELDNISDEDAKLKLMEEVDRILRRECPGKKADCTLLAVVESEQGKIIVFHIGDGLILEVGSESKLISLPENGMFSNITYFLGDFNAMDHLRIYRIEKSNNDSIILCSDGISDSLYNALNDEIAIATYKMSDWLLEYDESYTEDLLSIALEEMFRIKTADDMSIGIIEIVKGEKNDDKQY